MPAFLNKKEPPRPGPRDHEHELPAHASPPRLVISAPPHTAPPPRLALTRAPFKLYLAPLPPPAGAEGSLFYAPKAVPAAIEPLISACIEGNVEAARRCFKPSTLSLVQSLGREDTGHPLLHAVHRLHVATVRFLLEEQLNPRQRGTVHPYTGDSFMVSDLQGISSLELIQKMAFLFPRRCV